MATPVGYGTLLECPYNKAHRVQATAMARHLFKCRKMYPDVQFVTCPFNHAHKIAEPELKMHTATCEDRANFDMYKYCITTAAATHTSSEAREPELIYNECDPIAPKKVQDDDECWDDLRIPAYNPQEYCAQAKIIRKATLKTPSEKKAFYEQEMIRHKQLMFIKQEQKEKEDSGSSSGDQRSRSRSPVRYRKRSPSVPRKRSPSVPRKRSPSVPRERAKRSVSRSRSRSRQRTKRSRSRSRRRSPPPTRSRRSRSNSRKSRSVSPLRERRRKRSRSVDRAVRRSPSPLPVRRDRYDYDRSYERYPRLFDRYDRYGYQRQDTYGHCDRFPRRDHYERFDNRERMRRDSMRDSRDRDDEEHIYRRDFRD